MRDMAKVVTVKSVIPMWQKDRICAVNFNENGYEVIVPKEDAVPGKALIFIEADSILPVKPEWEFLRKRCYKPMLNGFLIKAMVMGKKDIDGEEGPRVRSWGLAVTPESISLTDVKVGDDLTDKLEIRKYEPADDASPNPNSVTNIPAFIKWCSRSRFSALRNFAWAWKEAYRNKGGFPTNLISKSDETTVENMPWVLKEHAEDFVYTTAKMEGQSVTALLDVKNFFGIKKIHFYVCSRNMAYKTDNGNAFWSFAKAHDLPQKFKAYYKRTGMVPIIQAEQCGPGIQSNIYNLPTYRWFVYAAKEWNPSTDECKQLSWDGMVFMAREFGLDTVPLIERDVQLKDIMPNVEAAEKYAEKAYYKIFEDRLGGGRIEKLVYPPKGKEIPADEKLWCNYMMHEGVVVRSMNCDKDRNIGCSFKIKNIAYAELDLAKMAKAVRLNIDSDI